MGRGARLAFVLGLLAAVAALGMLWRPGPSAAPAMSNSERLALYDRLEAAVVTVPGVTAIHREEYLLRVHLSTVEARAMVQREMVRLGLPEWTVEVVEARRLMSTAHPLSGCRTDVEPPAAPTTGGLGVGLSLSRGVLRPGESFSLSVSGWREEGVTRSSATLLECWTGEEWQPVYQLVPGAQAQVYDEWLWLHAEGVRGVGPETLVLPKPLRTGWYRLRKLVSLDVAGGRAVSPVAVFRVGRPGSAALVPPAGQGALQFHMAGKADQIGGDGRYVVRWIVPIPILKEGPP